jgi:hypothetical protein
LGTEQERLALGAEREIPLFERERHGGLVVGKELAQRVVHKDV